MMRDQELAGLAMVLGRDANIKVTISGDESKCAPDGSHINIARMPATPLGRMLMTGLVFHEVDHKDFTTGGKPPGLLGDMMNVIEDVRVEMEGIKKRPGTRFNLDAVTTYYAKQGSLEPKTLPKALLGKVMAYGRGRVLNQTAILPLEETCNEMMDDAFGQDFIDEVEAIIKDIPNLTHTKDTEKMSQQLIDLLIQQKNPPPPPPQQSPQQQQQEVGGQGDKGEEESQDQSHVSQGNGGDSQDENEQGQQGQGQGGKIEDEQEDQEDGNGTGQNQPQSKLDNQQDQDQDDQGSEDSNQTASGSGGNGAGSGGGNRPTPEEIDEMLKNGTGYGDLSRMIQEELDKMAATTPKSVKAGVPCLPDVGRMKSRNGRLDEVEAISASSRMRAKIMGQLQSIKRQPESFGSSGRKLATGRLVKMATGDPKIFKKKIETVEINTAITVLLDLSGSMDDKYHIANPAAFALHNTLFGLRGVSVCSCEFSGKSNSQPEINILVDFGKKPTSECFNHYPFDGTPTHDAIWVGRAMLLQRPEPRKIMLILTDGCPCNGTATRTATARAMKEGIEITAIGILDNSVRNYWTNNKVINNIQELPAAMFGVMEELLTKGNRHA